MQILEIVLYGKNGEKRVLPFKIGRVNIITGASATGKSALIYIVDYCLGRKSCPVPEGVIRETVAWFGLRLQFESAQVFIARENPSLGKSTTNRAYIKQGYEVQSPEIGEIVSNTTAEAIVAYLSQRIGISPNKNIPDVDETRPPLEANIKHSLLFCFQNQSLIADKDNLFYRQSDDFMTQAIKDTLPYFLGAVQEDRLAIEQQLKQARRELKLAEQQLRRIENIRGEGAVKAVYLLAEAQQVGLLEESPVPDEIADVIKLLVNTQYWTPEVNSFVNSDRLSRLQDEFYIIRNEMIEKSDQIKALKSFAKESEGFLAETFQQGARLESIGIFKGISHDNSTCPMCSQELLNRVPHVDEIEKSLEQIRMTLDLATRESPRLREHINKLEVESGEIRLRLTKKQEEIDAVFAEIEEARMIRDVNVRRGKVVGRISLWLESIEETKDDSVFVERVKNKQEEVKWLEEQLDEDTKQEILRSILNRISIHMTELSARLELEYSGSPVRLDLGKVTVMVDRERPMPLSNIGSGKNWLGAHIITLLALHSYFRSNLRPVPGFLFLDQPTQVFYPPDYNEERRRVLGDITDEDRKAVSSLFDLIFDIVESITPKLQIILTDHADLPDARFQSAIVETWRGNKALIPTDWLNSS